MSKIGYLKPVKTGTIEELHGEIKTLQTQLKIRLVPDLLKSTEASPDYIICAQGDIQIGAAWRKKKQQIGDIDLEFLSITIDDPSFPNAFNVAAFRNKEGGWDITWRRRQQGQFSETSTAA